MFGRRKRRKKSLVDVVSFNMRTGKPGPRTNVSKYLYPIKHSSQN